MSTKKDRAATTTGDTGSEAKGDAISLRALARLIGVDDKAIRNGIRSGRLTQSIGRTASGRPAVIDAELARQEWTANAGKLNPARTAESAPSAPTSAVVVSVNTLNEAQRSATLERARKLRLDNELQEGRLIDVGKAAKEAFESSRIIREAILNIPGRLSAELAAETDAGKVYMVLDRALRDALSVAADRLEAEAG